MNSDKAWSLCSTVTEIIGMTNEIYHGKLNGSRALTNSCLSSYGKYVNTLV